MLPQKGLICEASSVAFVAIMWTKVTWLQKCRRMASLFASILTTAVAQGVFSVCPSVHSSNSGKHDISGMPGGNFSKFGTSQGQRMSGWASVVKGEGNCDLAEYCFSLNEFVMTTKRVKWRHQKVNCDIHASEFVASFQQHPYLPIHTGSWVLPRIDAPCDEATVLQCFERHNVNGGDWLLENNTCNTWWLF